MMDFMGSPDHPRDSSPMLTPSASQEEDMSLIVTPRSKVKAMLAAIDDEEGSDDSCTSHMEASESGMKGALKCTLPKSNESEVLGEDDDDEPLTRRGRLAARLQAQSDQQQTLSPGAMSDSPSPSIGTIQQPIQMPKENHARIARGVSEDKSDHENTTDQHWDKTMGKAKEGVLTGQSSPAWPRKAPSPGLFLTPRRSSSPQPNASPVNHSNSDSDLPEDPKASVRFQALVARKRAERVAKEKSEAERKSKRSAQLKSKDSDAMLCRSTVLPDMSGDETENSDAAQKLTQHARPTRKASRKAIEEMNRETQRMNRNMQLAHEARTRKKITKESLFARFNYAMRNSDTLQTASSSTPASDTEGDRRKDMPGTSPCGPGASLESLESVSGRKDYVQVASSEDLLKLSEELPTVSEVFNHPNQSISKGKGKALGLDIAINPPKIKHSQKSPSTPPAVRLQLRKPAPHISDEQIDSDSDLEILPTQRARVSRLDVFDRLPVKSVTEGRSLQTLRALAHLRSPSKQQRNMKSTMTSTQMQTTLQQRARQQAARERAEKLQDLKDRGIVVQTAEERERDQVEVENLFDKARKEAEVIKKKEKDIASMKKQADRDGKELIDSSDGDNDYEGETADASDVDSSGSEQAEVVQDAEGSDPEEGDQDSEEVDEEEVEEGDPEGNALGLIDDEASEDTSREDEDASSEDDTNNILMLLQKPRKPRLSHVVEDDDDDVNEHENFSPITILGHGLNVGAMPLIPGMPTTNLPSMGLTQAFVATMADTESQACEGSEDGQEQDSMNFLECVSEPNASTLVADESLNIVFDSQKAALESGMPLIDIQLSQSQFDLDRTNNTQYDIATQYSEIPDPSQNVGFGASSPIAGRYMTTPPSTVDTVLLSNVAEDVVETVKKRGRLRPRAQEINVPPDATGGGGDKDEVPLRTARECSLNRASAYDVMKKTANKPRAATDPFNKRKSGAKGMVEEQAEESEDEYAGLGGASDDESAAEEDEEVRKMIDEGEVEVDERELAAFYADKERATDEKAVEKLFKDINSGMLRRKRGAEFDLSDSDDDVEARRRAKRKEFAKMRKALLENENVGKIAEDPKKLAFLRAIEDRDEDPDLDFLDQPEETSQVDASAQAEGLSQPLAPETAPLKRKRPLQDSIPDSANRPPPQARRTRTTKKPFTLAEIRESVSFLIEEPHAISFGHIPGSSSDIEDDTTHPNENENATITNHHRTNPIIDRISLKRAESASTSSANSKLAFHNPTTNIAPGGFKIPSLLRRATTQITNVENYGVTAGTERAAGGGEKGDFVRRGGSKKSSVNFWTREREKGKMVREIEREREIGRLRLREGRMDVLAGLGVGRFD